MSYLARIAVLADEGYEFADQDEQEWELKRFVNVIGDAEVDHETSDPDVGRNHVEAYWEDWRLSEFRADHDSPIAQAVREAKEEGIDDDKVLDILWSLMKFQPCSGYRSPEDTVVYAPLSEGETDIDGIGGTVNGQQVDSVWAVLTQGLTEQQIKEAVRGANYSVRITRHGVTLRYSLENHAWCGVVDADDFKAKLRLATPLSLDAPVDIDHGGASEIEDVQRGEVAVPHAKEQLLRHLLRFAR